MRKANYWSISAFDESEAALRTVYPDFHPVKNMDTGEFGEDSLNTLRADLDREEAGIKQNLQDITQKRLDNKNKLSYFEEECQKLRDEYPALAIEKNKKESAYQLFDEERKEIEKILRSYQLKEEWMFDKEKLRIPINADKEKYQKLINDLNVENSLYRKRLKQYESGKASPLSDEIKQIFDDKNIFVEFGHEWLKNLPDNKKTRLRLVKNNPFLPYALIVSKKDFDLIKSIEFNDILSPVIPIIEREKLEELPAMKGINHVYAMGDMNFLIPFDDRVLDKNYLKELCDEISLKINKNNMVIENAQQSFAHITSDILKIEKFAYTEQEVQKLLNEIKIVTEKWEDNSLQITAYEEEIRFLKKIDTEDLSLQGSLENAKDKFIRKKDDIIVFIKKCEQYSKDLNEKSRKEEALKVAGISLATVENDIARTKTNLEDIKLTISNVSSVLEKQKLQHQKYADATQGKLLEEEIENLESKLMVYNSKISGKIRTLQDILFDYRQQREEKQRTIESYGIEEQNYIGKEYRASLHEEIREEAHIKNKKLSELSSDKNEVQFKIAERTSDLNYRKKSIAEHCGRFTPMQRELIKELDFEKEKALQEAARKDMEKRILKVKKQENNLQRVQFGLEEYRDFALKMKELKNTELRNIEGDMGEYVVCLIKEYKECKVSLNDNKNTIATYYTELENEFALAAMYRCGSYLCYI